MESPTSRPGVTRTMSSVRRKPVPYVDAAELSELSDSEQWPRSRQPPVTFSLSVDIPPSHTPSPSRTATVKTSDSSSRPSDSPSSLFESQGPLPSSSALTDSTSLHAPIPTDDGLKKSDAVRHGRRLSKRRPNRPLPPPPFERDTPLTLTAIERAADLEVFDERGTALPFGDLFMGQRTVFCFIRHFWCPLCQQYVASIVRAVDPELLERAGVKLVIVSHGSPRMIAAYRRILKCPFPVFTDPSRALYRTLGMTLRSMARGPEEEKGDYIERTPVGSIVLAVKNATRMPLAKPGDIPQLGGEFCLGPGLRSDYAHRMHTTRAHASIRAVLAAAGVTLSPAPSIVQAETEEAVRTEEWEDVGPDVDGTTWMSAARATADLAAVAGRRRASIATELVDGAEWADWAASEDPCGCDEEHEHEREAAGWGRRESEQRAAWPVGRRSVE